RSVVPPPELPAARVKRIDAADVVERPCDADEDRVMGRYNHHSRPVLRHGDRPQERAARGVEEPDPGRGPADRDVPAADRELRAERGVVRVDEVARERRPEPAGLIEEIGDVVPRRAHDDRVVARRDPQPESIVAARAREHEPRLPRAEIEDGDAPGAVAAAPAPDDYRIAGDGESRSE